jgi:adenosylmethionine-8-amino-7-oxononanoate aminotransferase
VSGRLGDTPRGGPVHAFFLPRGTARRPVIARAEGIHLWDTEGRRYLDGSSGPVVSNLGHGNRRVLDAMRAQAERATFAYPGLFESEANVALADLVCELAGPGLDRAFFVSGGSEATEAAIKLARQYMVAIGQPERVTVIAREPSYHGGTLGALAVTATPAPTARSGRCCARCPASRCRSPTGCRPATPPRATRARAPRRWRRSSPSRTPAPCWP